MATIFKYDNKYYQAMNLDKKLKRLNISKEDIEIIYSGDISQSELEKKILELTKTPSEIEENTDTQLYYFLNKDTGYSYISIYPECNKQGYEPSTLENLERLWHKDGKV